MARALSAAARLSLFVVVAGCGSSAGTSHDAADGATRDGGVSRGPDGAAGDDAAAGTDAGSAHPSRFVTKVFSFSPTECTGFGQSSMPGIVEGPPVGGGSDHGSVDVVSLGSGGSIVVEFEDNAIVDGPGPDFIVFENPFWIGGNASDVYAEPGEISVSDDGATWKTFPCAPTVDPQAGDGTGVSPPYGSCAGWHVVYSAPGNGISPLDPATAGGDAFDLADVGVTHARFVRIVDQTREACPDSGTRPDTNGFDLDAVAIVNAETP